MNDIFIRAAKTFFQGFVGSLGALQFSSVSGDLDSLFIALLAAVGAGLTSVAQNGILSETVLRKSFSDREKESAEVGEKMMGR